MLVDIVDGKAPSSLVSAVDLFCGAGGLSCGLQRAGIEICAGVDSDPNCKYPFEFNLGATFYKRDASQLRACFLDSMFPDRAIKVLAGCAPCQPYSTYSGGKSDPQQRWQLLSKFGELVQELVPDIVTMENVPRLMSHRVFDEFTAVLESAGYFVSNSVVKCADYGIPQTRERLVLLASRLGCIRLAPPTTPMGDGATVRAAIEHLAPIGAGQTDARDRLHQSSGLSERNVLRIQNSMPGGTWRDWDPSLRAACHLKESGRTYPSVYGRMEWDRPSPTITTQFHGYGNGRFGHPVQNRAISLREGALLQTFPDTYSFVAESEPIRIGPVARLIGNAVPVKLGEVIGTSIISHVEATQ